MNARATPVYQTRWYGTVLNLDDVDGEPVLTFTWNSNGAPVPYNAPVAAYLRRIAAGLSESHGLTRAGIVDYLASRRGIREVFTRADVDALLREEA